MREKISQCCQFLEHHRSKVTNPSHVDLLACFERNIEEDRAICTVLLAAQTTLSILEVQAKKAKEVAATAQKRWFNCFRGR